MLAILIQFYVHLGTLLLALQCTVVQEVPDFVSPLKNLSTNWHGRHAEFSSTNISKPTNIPKILKTWVDSSGGIIRHHSTTVFENPRGTRHYDKWSIVTNDFVFRRSEAWTDDEEAAAKLTFTARVAQEGSDLIDESSMLPFQSFFGRDGFTGAYWFEVLQDSKSVVKIENLENEIQVSVSNSSLGNFKFFFLVDGEEKLLSRLECKNSNLQPRSEKGNIVSYSYKVEGIGYEEFDGQKFISSIGRFEQESKRQNGQTYQTVFKQSLLNFSSSHSWSSDRISFPNHKIPDGTQVNVQNDKGVPYEIRGGVLVKVVDSGMISNANESRFRKPQGFSPLWYAGSVGVIVVAIGIVVIWRRRYS